MSIDKQGKGSDEYAVEKNTKRTKENWSKSGSTHSQSDDTRDKVKKVVK